jgi:uncharacterized membrane protein
MRKMREFSKRSVAKTATYRVTVIAASYVALLVLSGGNQALAVTFAGVSTIYSTAIYYLHERAWAWTDWGRKE